MTAGDDVALNNDPNSSVPGIAHTANTNVWLQQRESAAAASVTSSPWHLSSRQHHPPFYDLNNSRHQHQHVYPTSQQMNMRPWGNPPPPGYPQHYSQPPRSSSREYAHQLNHPGGHQTDQVGQVGGAARVQRTTELRQQHAASPGEERRARALQRIMEMQKAGRIDEHLMSRLSELVS